MVQKISAFTREEFPHSLLLLSQVWLISRKFLMHFHDFTPGLILHVGGKRENKRFHLDGLTCCPFLDLYCSRNKQSPKSWSPIASPKRPSGWKRKSESVSCSVLSDLLGSHGLQSTRFLGPWNSPIGVGRHSLPQAIFSTQGLIFLTQRLNPGLLHCRQIFYCLSHQRSPSFSTFVQTMDSLE